MRSLTRLNAAVYLSVIGLLLAGVVGWYAFSFKNENNIPSEFDGQRALADVETQVSFGPRIPGTDGHDRFQEWLSEELKANRWMVEIQYSQQGSHAVENIVAKRGSDSPEIILGAHYDSRIYADNDSDPALREQPVPGANDGASGVAVLLELARSLPEDAPPVWLVFFDAEDNGRIGDWEWILGSRAFVAQNPVAPRAVVIVDMVGDADLNLYWEVNSDEALRAEIWQLAEQQGYGRFFIPQTKYSMLDDHTPFLEAGIPAVDIIDFDYPHWHTTGDTPDKVSAESLEAVGATLRAWILGQNQQ